MFKNILVPTDGSALSHKAAEEAVALAKRTGARITAFHVAPAYKFNLREECVPGDFVWPADYQERVRSAAHDYLAEIEVLAAAAGVSCESHYATSDFAANAIVDAAEQYGCDGIVMGSHGRTGLSWLIHGSETRKVLGATQVPVLVTH